LRHFISWGGASYCVMWVLTRIAQIRETRLYDKYIFSPCLIINRTYINQCIPLTINVTVPSHVNQYCTIIKNTAWPCSTSNKIKSQSDLPETRRRPCMNTKQTSETRRNTNNHITCRGCRRVLDQSPQTPSYSKQNFEKAAGQNLKEYLLESESRVPSR
jgi:hypothetical protein